MSQKENLLSCIEDLKREKPDGWKRDVRNLLKKLAKLDDPYGDAEWRGTEVLGRSTHRADCPTYDGMGDNSFP